MNDRVIFGATGLEVSPICFGTWQLSPRFWGERFRAIAAEVKGLAPLAKRYEFSTYQLILAATLMHPGIHVAVVGIKNPPQITEAVAASGKTMSRQDYFAIRKALAVDGTSKTKDASGEKK